MIYLDPQLLNIFTLKTKEKAKNNKSKAPAVYIVSFYQSCIQENFKNITFRGEFVSFESGLSLPQVKLAVVNKSAFQLREFSVNNAVIY